MGPPDDPVRQSSRRAGSDASAGPAKVYSPIPGSIGSEGISANSAPGCRQCYAATWNCLFRMYGQNGAGRMVWQRTLPKPLSLPRRIRPPRGIYNAGESYTPTMRGKFLEAIESAVLGAELIDAEENPRSESRRSGYRLRNSPGSESKVSSANLTKSSRFIIHHRHKRLHLTE